ncbi:MAG: cyclophilin-like fold protein [Nitrospiraceae bacterium]
MSSPTQGAAQPPKKIRIRVGGVQIEAELKSNKTAASVYAALPVTAPLNVWGEEFFCKVDGVKDFRETATTTLKVGDVAWWGPGQVLALFFGPTPMSSGPDPVPADRVNVIGRIVGDPTLLRQGYQATTIRVEPVDVAS